MAQTESMNAAMTLLPQASSQSNHAQVANSYEERIDNEDDQSFSFCDEVASENSFFRYDQRSTEDEIFASEEEESLYGNGFTKQLSSYEVIQSSGPGEEQLPSEIQSPRYAEELLPVEGRSSGFEEQRPPWEIQSSGSAELSSRHGEVESVVIEVSSTPPEYTCTLQSSIPKDSILYFFSNSDPANKTAEIKDKKNARKLFEARQKLAKVFGMPTPPVYYYENPIVISPDEEQKKVAQMSLKRRSSTPEKGGKMSKLTNFIAIDSEEEQPIVLPSDEECNESL